jgi:coenzyme F420-reducing hydrogenase delta subunit
VAEVKNILQELKVEPERVEMFHVGASDATGWVDAVNEMVRRARKLGPSPLNHSVDLEMPKATVA